MVDFKGQYYIHQPIEQSKTLYQNYSHYFFLFDIIVSTEIAL